jgi:hypothetical protein
MKFVSLGSSALVSCFRVCTGAEKGASKYNQPIEELPDVLLTITLS